MLYITTINIVKNNINVVKSIITEFECSAIFGGSVEFETDTFSFKEEVEEGSSLRAKTSNRLHYEAQVEVLKKQLGNLEKIRLELGLSQRKISQLLLVDPSAWTRWNRPGEEAPPHVWRSLQWYLALREKIPGLTPQYFLGQDPKVLHEKALQKIAEERSERENQLQSLRNSLTHLEKENLRLKKQQRILFAALLSVSLWAILKWIL